MNEETVNSFGTPEMMTSGESLGKAMASKSKEKKIPHYLRASTGSCHDLCKYGKKQIPLEKPWRSTAKKSFKKTLHDDLNETLKSGSSKTKKVIEVKNKNDSSEVIKREVVKYRASGVSSGLKKPEALTISSGDETPVKQMQKKMTLRSKLKKQEALTISCGDVTPVKQMQKKMTLRPKLKPSPDLGSHSSGNANALKPKTFTKSCSALATSKSKVNGEQVASPVLKLKMGNKSGEKEEDTKIKKATVSSRVVPKKATVSSSRVVPKKVPLTPRASVSPRLAIKLPGNSTLKKTQSLKASSSRPNQKPRRVNRTDESNKQLDSYPVEEKTLHVVEMETTNKGSEKEQSQECIVEPFPPLPPTQSTQEDDECTVSEREDYEYPSGSNEAESAEEEIGMSNGEKKPRGKNEGDSPEEAARKLNFRRGKVVNPDTVGESARKLKFRKGKVLGEDKEQDAIGRRSFKKREDIREEEVDEDGEKVVLRHQDVQEKDAQGLLNNVIEETASKLVEARKSKVKALVGAFETVISLQESKPPSNSETGNLD